MRINFWIWAGMVVFCEALVYALMYPMLAPSQPYHVYMVALKMMLVVIPNFVTFILLMVDWMAYDRDKYLDKRRQERLQKERDALGLLRYEGGLSIVMDKDVTSIYGDNDRRIIQLHNSYIQDMAESLPKIGYKKTCKSS